MIYKYSPKVNSTYNQKNFNQYDNFYSITYNGKKYIPIYGHFIEDEYSNIFYCKKVNTDGSFRPEFSTIDISLLYYPNNDNNHIRLYTYQDVLDTVKRLNNL